MPASPTMLLRSGNSPMSARQLEDYVNDWLFTERDQTRIDFLDQVLLMNRILNDRNPSPCPR